MRPLAESRRPSEFRAFMPRRYRTLFPRIMPCITAALLLSGCLDMPRSPASHSGPQGQTASGKAQTCRVTRVSDGDTLDALCGTGSRAQKVRIRLRGIDAPELRQPHGTAARQRLNQLCHQQTIRLPQRPDKDRYGRVLADVQCQQQDAGELLVRSGLAWYYRSTARDYPTLVKLETQAKRHKRGLWGDAKPTPPWVWRQQNRR